VAVPSGEPITLPAGETVQITHRLGGSLTVTWQYGMARINRMYAANLGEESSDEKKQGGGEGIPTEKELWDSLKNVFDPEIPVNIVDLGLVYSLELVPISNHPPTPSATEGENNAGLRPATQPIRNESLAIPIYVKDQQTSPTLVGRYNPAVGDQTPKSSSRIAGSGVGAEVHGIPPAQVKAYKVLMKMTLTAPGCGMGPSIAADARERLLQIPGIADAQVDIVWDPPWNPGMISEAGKMQMGMI
jgi:metal-sulfur cluster biosynthetic enzyme